MQILFCLLMLGLAGCGKHGASDNKDDDRLKSVNEKLVRYLIMIEDEQQDEQSWIETDHCDALLFQSLAKVAGMKGGSIFYAEDNGRWYRRPAKDCLSSGSSKSSISRDMILGLLFYIWQEKDVETLDRLIAYGEANKWILGEHDGSADGRVRVRADQGFNRLIYEVRQRLGGKKIPNDVLPYTWLPTSGFASHLQMLSILLLGIMRGEIDQVMLNTAKSNANRNPNNALFKAVVSRFTDGNMARSAELLLDPTYHPNQTLPTSENRCSSYIYQREELKNGKRNPDWLPCDRGEHHSGIDFVFAAGVTLDLLRR